MTATPHNEGRFGFDRILQRTVSFFGFPSTYALVEHPNRNMDSVYPEQGDKHKEHWKQEIANIMGAIKAGILTETMKAELEKAEAERAALLESLQGHAKGLKKIVSFLPNAGTRYRQLVANLERLPQRYVAEARRSCGRWTARRFHWSLPPKAT